MTDTTSRPLLCSDCSRQVGEQIFGTAPRTDLWILLEYAGAWGNKALPESDLPQPIKDKLDGWLTSVPNSKFQFIKRERGREGSTLFIALISETEPRLYQFELQSYDELLDLDISAIVAHDPGFDTARRYEPIFVVCTNGRRDAACAQYGPPVFREMERAAGDSVWQGTHIGGHRFAATFVCLPEGVCYGHVDADDAVTIIEQHRRGEIDVEKTRGRSCYDAPVQAADYYLRGLTGIREIMGLQRVSITQTDDEQWRVRFRVTQDGTLHDIHLIRRLSEWVSLESTGDPEMKHFPQFHLVAHTPDVEAE